MDLFRKTFPNKHTFLVVIHILDVEQALRNAKIAYEEGADGVFLINHGVHYSILLDCYDHVCSRFPNMWVGANMLEFGNEALSTIRKGTAGLWSDYAGIVEDANDPVLGARRFKELREKSDWKGIYFGGVAFKGQTPVRDFARVARLALPFVDVITTSGNKTGTPPSVEKICLMKEAIGERPLAVASGLSAENVERYPHDCSIVASSISTDEFNLDPQKVGDFKRAVCKI